MSETARPLKVSPSAAGLNAGVLVELDAAARRFVESGQIPGAVVLIARNGEVGHLAAYGKMGMDREDPMGTDAVFRIYSMTKPITTAVALMLFEEGAFALDDPVGEWLPELRHLRLLDGSLLARDITVRDLMCHTAGFTNSFGRDPLATHYRREKVSNGSLDTLVDVLGRLPLLHQPGERFHYSIATDVLGKLVEIWTGMSLDLALKARLFKPLGMTDTAFSVDAGTVEGGRLTTNHVRRADGSLAVIDSGWSSTYRQVPERLAGASGLVSTAADYFKFAQMLMDNGVFENRRILQPETVALMNSNQLRESAFPVGVIEPLPGLGFGMGMSVRVGEHLATDAGARVGECGWGGAAGTHFWLSPVDQLVVVTLRQTMPYETRFENVLKPIAYRSIS